MIFLTLQIMLMLLMIHCDPMPLFHKPCETIQRIYEFDNSLFSTKLNGRLYLNYE
jgi:hypothetical protein